MINKNYKTNKEIRIEAKKLNLKEVNCGKFPKGQLVFKHPDKKFYYSYDIDGHNGGVWKGAKRIDDLFSKHTRCGTYDENLNRIGD